MIVIQLRVICWCGAGVWASGGRWPDIAAAAIIACLSLSSTVRVLKRAAQELEAATA